MFHYDTSHINDEIVGLKHKIWEKNGIEMNENGIYIHLILLLSF